jgi:hypothetical protein
LASPELLAEVAAFVTAGSLFHLRHYFSRRYNEAYGRMLTAQKTSPTTRASANFRSFYREGLMRGRLS